MDILHIIPVNATYLVPLANMLQQKDKENTHTFFVTTVFQAVVKNNVDLLQIRGLQCTPGFKRKPQKNKNRYIINRAKKADHIVWHSFRTNDGYIPFLLFKNRQLLKKSTWIPAEGEIGNYMNVPDRFLSRFTKRVNDYVRHNIRYIGVENSADKTVLESEGLYHANVSVLPYPGNRQENEVLSACVQDDIIPAKKHVAYVQIGLSSQSSNHHAQLIDLLSELPDHTDAISFIHFCASLDSARFESGTKMYKNKIRQNAKKLECACVFKDKAVSPDSYLKYLRQMDIVLLANDKSCQMPLLFALLALKKRIFLPQESPLYTYLNELGANVYSLEQLTEAGSLSAAMELPGSNLPAQLQSYYHESNVLTYWAKWSQSINA